MQLPEIVENTVSEKAGIDKLSKSVSFLFGLVALFAYVATQIGVNCLFFHGRVFEIFSISLKFWDSVPRIL